MACTVTASVGDLDAPASVGDLDAPAGDAGSDVASVDGNQSDREDTGPSTSDTGTPDAPATIDAGCGVIFAQEASFIDIGLVQGPTPNLMGGAVVTGLYELIAMRVYFGPHEGTMQVRETMRVRGSTTAGAFDRLTEARAATGTFVAYPIHGETITWNTGAGPAIFQSPECPVRSFESPHRFGVSGDTLTLFDDQDAIERVYRRIR